MASNGKAESEARAARLKAALRANLAKRKAQGRALDDPARETAPAGQEGEPG